MLFDISELDPRGVGLDVTVEIPPFPWEGGEVVSCEPAALVGRLTPTRRGIELLATYTTVVHQTCSRCLTAMARPLNARVRLFLVPPEDPNAPRRYEEIPDDDPDAVDLYPLERPVVDFSEVLREQVDLALPMRTVCREDCRGLCSGCGADLNTETCRCRPARDDRFSRLEQLKSLLKRRKGADPSRGR